MSETLTEWNGIPPNGQGMYHWLVNKDHGRHVVAWFDLYEWTAFGTTQTKQEIAAMYDYLAPCNPPTPDAEAERLRAALRKLANEVEGAWGIAELDIRCAIGNTNYQCVKLRLDEARAALGEAHDG